MHRGQAWVLCQDKKMRTSLTEKGKNQGSGRQHTRSMETGRHVPRLVGPRGG